MSISLSSVITATNDGASPARATRMLLRMVRAAQPISRADLARRLNLNRSTVTEIFKPLINSGAMREDPLPPGGNASRGQGRPPLGLSFVSDREYFVGVNLGVRRSQVGLSNLSGEILAEEEFDTPPEEEQALWRLRAGVEKLCAQVPEKELKIIGVSVPGPTNAERSKLLYAPQLGWRDVDVAGALRIRTQRARAGVPVIVENDATAAAMYEARLRLRDSKDGLTDNFVLVRSGTGIGVGLVLGGEVYRGTGAGEGIAGEFGHMTIMAGGKPCPCGNRGCWERYASASAASSLYTGDRVQLGGQRAPRFVEIVGRAEAGELRAQRTLERIGEYLGVGIANVIMGIGVAHVIVSGRVVYGWKFIREPLLAAVRQSMAGKIAGCSVEAGEPTGAGIGGALEVAAEEFLATGFRA